jgi:hypothetical protein
VGEMLWRDFIQSHDIVFKSNEKAWFTLIMLGHSSQNQIKSVAQFIATTVYYIFYSVTAEQQHPEVLGFRKYIQNILECSTNNVNTSVIFISLLYVSKYVSNAKSLGITYAGTEIKVWSASLMLADVYLNDAAYAVKSWSDVTGIPIKECISIRKTFLQMIKYTLHVTLQEYNTWISKLYAISDHANTVLAYKCRQNYLQRQEKILYQSLMKPQHSHTYPMSDMYLNANNNVVAIQNRRPSVDIYHAALGDPLFQGPTTPAETSAPYSSFDKTMNSSSMQYYIRLLERSHGLNIPMAEKSIQYVPNHATISAPPNYGSQLNCHLNLASSGDVMNKQKHFVNYYPGQSENGWIN